jgi:ABC-type Zn uptake system ZnuABC Zn-binding protein ZnuA
MKNLLNNLLIIVLCFFSTASFAKLNIMTTTTNLKSIVDFIGGEQVKTFSFCKGSQDPHFLEAKPSYMIKASRADLLISIGLELEIGWLPLVVRGARNPKLRVGQGGRLVVGNFVETLEKPTGTLTRADGDVHPFGNPHILLDPLNAVKVAKAIQEKISVLDKENSDLYDKNFNSFKEKINKKMVGWKKLMPKNINLMTYHRTMSYFYNRFDINNVDILEPKPGVPPTVKHVMGLFKKAKKKDVKLILVENYFDATVANRVANEVRGIQVKSIPVAVGGEPGVKSIIELYDVLVKKVSL